MLDINSTGSLTYLQIEKKIREYLGVENIFASKKPI